jgi:hypothetical protein
MTQRTSSESKSNIRCIGDEYITDTIKECETVLDSIPGMVVHDGCLPYHTSCRSCALGKTAIVHRMLDALKQYSSSKDETLGLMGGYVSNIEKKTHRLCERNKKNKDVINKLLAEYWSSN